MNPKFIRWALCGLMTIAFLPPYTSYAQIAVSPNGRFLQDKTGKPFFWLGDTDWELFHRMTRDGIRTLLDTRKAQGFNVIQAVALAEFEGLRTPNRYGDYALVNFDPLHPAEKPGSDSADAAQYDYWDHVDFAIREAANRGMYVGLLPTWGDKITRKWGDGPVVFDSVNAEAYAAWLARRYEKQWNIIWILGGDRPAVYASHEDGSPADDRPVWRAMARGIRSVFGPGVFIAYHPAGGRDMSTSKYLRSENWLSMNAMQSGHGSREAAVWNWVADDYALTPAMPTLDMEPCYEDHPVNPWDGHWTRKRGYFSAYDVRVRTYRSVFAGGCGVTYGDHQVWQFLDTVLYAPINIGDTIIGWHKAIRSEAAGEMQYLKKLMLSRPYFNRIPDESLVLSDHGSSYVDYVSATRDAAGSYALIHLPLRRAVKIDMSKITGARKNISWYNPRSGRVVKSSFSDASVAAEFTPPGDQDWVLVIDDASKHYPPPGAF